MACPLHTPSTTAERCRTNLPQAQTERAVTQMAYYWTCPRCGANLDPGEVCEDCRTTERDAHQPTKQCERPYKPTAEADCLPYFTQTRLRSQRLRQILRRKF